MLRNEILEDFLNAKELLYEVIDLLSIDPIEIEDDEVDNLQMDASLYACNAMDKVGEAIEFLEEVIDEDELA